MCPDYFRVAPIAPLFAQTSRRGDNAGFMGAQFVPNSCPHTPATGGPMLNSGNIYAMEFGCL